MYKPNTVQIELVQGCNRRCSFCGTRGIEHKVHFISKEVLTRECQLVQESGYNPRILVACHGDHPGVGIKTSRSGFKSIKLNWRYWREIYDIQSAN